MCLWVSVDASRCGERRMKEGRGGVGASKEGEGTV